MPFKGQKAQLQAQAAEIERDLSAIRRVMRKPLEDESSKSGLTVPQKAVMTLVVRQDGISLKDLSAAMSLAHSTVSGIIDRLEKRRLVERRTDANDGRISRIHAAAVVKDFVHEKIPALSRGPLGSALQRATANERTQIAHALKRLRELLESAPESAP